MRKVKDAEVTGVDSRLPCRPGGASVSPPPILGAPGKTWGMWEMDLSVLSAERGLSAHEPSR